MLLFLFSQEDFLDLTVSVRGVSGLEEALWNMFVEEEMFEGNNLYRCSRCDQLVRAAKVSHLSELKLFLSEVILFICPSRPYTMKNLAKSPIIYIFKGVMSYFCFIIYPEVYYCLEV